MCVVVCSYYVRICTTDQRAARCARKKVALVPREAIPFAGRGERFRLRASMMHANKNAILPGTVLRSGARLFTHTVRSSLLSCAGFWREPANSSLPPCPRPVPFWHVHSNFNAGG